MTPSVERIITSGLYGDALDRNVSIVTEGWFDSFWYANGFKPKITELGDIIAIKEIGDKCEITELGDKYSLEVE